MGVNDIVELEGIHMGVMIPARIYSPMIWETIKYRTKEYTGYKPDDVQDAPATVSRHTAHTLYLMARLFNPKVVVEIGTYIGRSASAIAQGMNDGVIHTCDTDQSRLQHLQWAYVGLKTYECISTEMFKKLTEPVDLFFFDGRIQPDDIEHIKRLSKPESIYLFDDFEGVEKGVANAALIQHLGGVLVYPEQGQTLGMMIRKIGFSRQ